MTTPAGIMLSQSITTPAYARMPPWVSWFQTGADIDKYASYGLVQILMFGGNTTNWVQVRIPTFARAKEQMSKSKSKPVPNLPVPRI